jgi:hypothetical protein
MNEEVKPYIIAEGMFDTTLICKSVIATHAQIKTAPGILWASNKRTDDTNPDRHIYEIRFDPLYPSEKAARVAFTAWLDSRVVATTHPFSKIGVNPDPVDEVTDF